MPDQFDKATRSRIMASIRSKNTKPELTLKKALRGHGFSYQPKMSGSPDFVHRKKKIALYVHGCYWHKCPKCFKEPQSNRKYWLPKLKRNVQRDKENRKLLEAKGYRVLEIWEHELKEGNNKLWKKLKNLSLR